MNTTKAVLIVLLTVLLGFSEISGSENTSQPQKEIIAMLGTGDMGDSLGPRLAKLGYTVIYGSRTPDHERVVALVERTGNGASATTSEIAARRADIIFLAMPWEPIRKIVDSADGMEGKIVVDLSWPEAVIGEDGYYQMTTKPSGAEVIQSWAPNAMVVKAFGTTGTNVIDDPYDAGGPVTIPIASDHREAKEVTARLVAELGLDPVDAGPLRFARNIEAMMELYMVPHAQGREAGWEFYFRRTNYWMCNQYTGGEEDESTSAVDADNLADIPHGQDMPEPCPK